MVVTLARMFMPLDQDRLLARVLERFDQPTKHKKAMATARVIFSRNC